ncbi:MAG: TolC family protein [Bacteroidales bacterium]
MRRILLFAVFLGWGITSFAGNLQQQRQDTLATVYSLEEFRSMALQESKSILISQEKINIATELKRAAYTQFFPNFSANGTYMWNQKNISILGEDAYLPVGSIMNDGSFGFRPEQISNKWGTVSGQLVPLDANGKPFNPKTEPGKIQWKDYAFLPKEAMEFDVQNVFAGGIGFIQPVFMGNKIRELYKISKSNEKVAEIQHKDEMQKLMIEVDEAYWRTVSLINKKKLAFKLKSLLEKLNRDVEAMLTEGVATKGDLLNVKVKLNEASLAFTRADNGVALSKMALFQLCGLDINGNYSLKDEDIEQAIINYKGNIDMARVLDNRPEIQQLEQLDNVAKSTLNIMKSRFMPNIAVAGNYIVSNPNVFNGFNSKFSGMFNASVVLNIPIFHFGDKVHTLRAAKSQKRIVEYKINEAKELITLQVTQSNFRINEANKKLESANSNIEAAEENLKLANEAYKEGLISISDLMAAQTAWASANSERIDAGIDVRLCELYLKRAKGEILENK